VAVHGRVLSAEAAERDADRALLQAKVAVREAREHVKRLEKEAAEEWVFHFLLSPLVNVDGGRGGGEDNSTCKGKERTRERLIELDCRARLAKIKQTKARDISKRAKPLGRKYLPMHLVILKPLAKALHHYRPRATSIRRLLLGAMHVVAGELGI
jgi:hypothetical protein